jgi:hypothetical protein
MPSPAPPARPNAVDTHTTESNMAGYIGLVKGGDCSFAKKAGRATQCKWQWLVGLPFEPLLARGTNPRHRECCQTLRVAAPAGAK